MKSGMAAEEAWQQGLPLGEALEEYSDPELWEEYEPIAALVMPKLPPADLPLEPFKPSDQIHRAALPPIDPARLMERFYSLDNGIKADVIRRLTAGELLAVGYPAPRRRRQPPVWILPSTWEQGRVSWMESELWTDTNAFEQVRVILSPAAAAASIVATIPPPEPTRPAGRPTRREDIRQAYIALREAGRIDFSALSRNIPLIREAALRLRGGDMTDTKGLKDSTIEFAIGEQFKGDRERLAPGNPPKNQTEKK